MICRGPAGDPDLARVEVWEDRLWRLSASVFSEVPGFCYLEPKRHIPFITDLDGEEAETLGPVLARTTSVLKEEVGAKLVFVLVFGGTIPHLHFHLVPFREGDPEPDLTPPGERVKHRLPGGLEVETSKDYPPLPEEELRAVADRIRERLLGPA